MEIGSLLQWFDEIILVQKELVICAEEKKKVIILNQMNELDRIVKGEQKCILESRNLEKKRSVIISTMFGNRMGEPVISEIISAVDDESKLKLQEKVTELTKLIGQIKMLNAENEQLLKQSLQFINRTLSAVTPVQKKSAGTYSATGSVDHKKNAGGFSSSI